MPASSGELRSGASSGSHSGGQNRSEVLADLKRCICENSPDSLIEAELDSVAHLYDAGYVTSITAADLLVYIKERYDLVIPPVDLAGRLDNLEALVAHILGE